MAALHIGRSTKAGAAPRLRSGRYYDQQGDSQQSSIIAVSAGENNVSSLYWCVVWLRNVHVNFGANPTAIADAGWIVPAGVPMFFSVSAKSGEIAIKNAV